MSLYLSREQKEQVARVARTWWQALQPRAAGSPPIKSVFALLGRADRARIERAASIYELENERAPQLLAEALQSADAPGGCDLSAWVRNHYEVILLLAGVLAQVREDDSKTESLVRAVGRAGNADKPPLNEIRFRRLIAAKGYEEFLLAARRVVVLRKRKAHVLTLAKDLLDWSQELGEITARPALSVRFRWAQDYYLAAKPQAVVEANSTTGLSVEVEA